MIVGKHDPLRLPHRLPQGFPGFRRHAVIFLGVDDEGILSAETAAPEGRVSLRQFGVEEVAKLLLAPAEVLLDVPRLGVDHPPAGDDLLEDVVGAGLGGSAKNVMAIATGICDGMKLGDNARAALITRGLAEMMRLGSALGAFSGGLLYDAYGPESIFYFAGFAGAIASTSYVFGHPSLPDADRLLASAGSALLFVFTALLVLWLRRELEAPNRAQEAFWNFVHDPSNADLLRLAGQP